MRWPRVAAMLLASAGCNGPSMPAASGTGSSGGEPATSSSTSAADSTGTSSDSGDLPPLAMGCIELDWVWTDASQSSGRQLVVLDDGLVVVSSVVTGAASGLRSLDLSGAPQSDFVPVPGSYLTDMAPAVDGGVVLTLGVPDGAYWDSRVQWRSAELLPTDEQLVPGGGESVAAAAVMDHAAGFAVVGAAVGVNYPAESLVMALRRDGSTAWRNDADHDFVLDLVPSPASSDIIALIADSFTEGSESFAEGYDPDGVLLWSHSVGSAGGNFNASIAPFTMVDDGEVGVVTLGIRQDPPTLEEPGKRFLWVGRFDESGEQWEQYVQVGELEDVNELGEPISGSLTRLGDRVVVVLDSVPAHAWVLDLEGTLRCDQRIPVHEDVSIKSVGGIDELGFVATGSELVGETEQLWLARLALGPDAQ